MVTLILVDWRGLLLEAVAAVSRSTESVGNGLDSSSVRANMLWVGVESMSMGRRECMRRSVGVGAHHATAALAPQGIHSDGVNGDGFGCNRRGSVSGWGSDGDTHA